MPWLGERFFLAAGTPDKTFSEILVDVKRGQLESKQGVETALRGRKRFTRSSDGGWGREENIFLSAGGEYICRVGYFSGLGPASGYRTAAASLGTTSARPADTVDILTEAPWDPTHFQGCPGIPNHMAISEPAPLMRAYIAVYSIYIYIYIIHMYIEYIVHNCA